MLVPMEGPNGRNLVTDRTGLLPYRIGPVPFGKNRTVPVPVPYRTFYYIRGKKNFLTCHDLDSNRGLQIFHM